MTPHLPRPERLQELAVRAQTWADRSAPDAPPYIPTRGEEAAARRAVRRASGAHRDHPSPEQFLGDLVEGLGRSVHALRGPRPAAESHEEKARRGEYATLHVLVRSFPETHGRSAFDDTRRLLRDFQRPERRLAALEAFATDLRTLAELSAEVRSNDAATGHGLVGRAARLTSLARSRVGSGAASRGGRAAP